MRILLDASNLGATGPEVIIKNLVLSLGSQAPHDDFIFLLPTTKSGEEWGVPANVRITAVRRFKIQEIGRMWDINFGLARLCRSCQADVYFTLGDVGPVRVGVPHLIYLHLAYLLYDEPELDAALSLFERIKLRYQRWHFFRSTAMADLVIVQTPVMKERLVSSCRMLRDKVKVIPPSLPAHVQRLVDDKELEGESKLFAPDSLNLLFLATYYAHKNHRILLPLLKELRRRGLDGKVHFYLTLDGDRRQEEVGLLKSLASESDMVTNLGRLSPAGGGRALHEADALFMPTLVETFGLIYLEAMAVRKPIITSDRDFARYVCGDLAFYFDPHDPVSITDAIQRLMAGREQFLSKVRKDAERQIEAVSGSVEDSCSEILQLLKTLGNRAGQHHD